MNPAGNCHRGLGHDVQALCTTRMPPITFHALLFLFGAQLGLTAMTWLAQELLIVHLVNLLLLLEGANLLPDLLNLL